MRQRAKWNRLHLPAMLVAAVAYGQSPEPSALTPGIPVARQIATGQVHTYRLAVEAGQFVRITAVQSDADIAIRLIQPDGKTFATVDRVRYGSVEDLPWIAGLGGTCTVEVRAVGNTKAGPYQFDVVVRPPNEHDRTLIAGFVAGWIEGDVLVHSPSRAAQREAIEKLEFAASEFRKAGEPAWESYALSQSAWTLYSHSEYVKARDRAQRAVDIRRTLDEPSGLAMSLTGLGRILTSLGEPERAIEALGEALEMRRRKGDRYDASRVLTSLGSAYLAKSEFQHAIECHTEALTIQRELGDKNWELISVSALADVYLTSGNVQASLEHRLEAWNMVVRKGDKLDQGRIALSLGVAYFFLGNYDLARQYYSQAEALARETGDMAGLAGALHRKGRDQALAGKFSEAVASFEEGMALRRKLGTPGAVTNDLGLLCQSLLAAGRREEARERGLEGLQLSRDIKYNEGAGRSLVCLGQLKLAEGDYGASRAQLSEALALFRGTGEFEVVTLAALAETERAANNLVESLHHIERATELMEAVRLPIQDPSLRASYHATRAGRVGFQTSLLMDLHKQDPGAGYGERAFNLAERWRGRSLTELVLASSHELRRELTDEQRQLEDRLLAGISGIQRELFRDGVNGLREQQLKRQLSAAEKEFELFQAGLQRGGNRYAAGRYAETWDAGRIRVELLDRESALVEYALGEPHSYAWVLTATGLTSVVLAGRGEIEGRVESYRRLLAERVNALTARSALARTDAEGRKLYQMLFAPLEAALGAKCRMTIVPDGALAYLPFEALPRGLTHMIDRFSIGYAPSASALAALRSRQDGRMPTDRTLLAMADPAMGGPAGARPELAAFRERGFSFTSLPSARTEVAGIRALFPPSSTSVYLGDRATEQVVKTEKLAGYRYLHFAAHGYFDEDQPLRSGIVLSAGGSYTDDGFLQSREIMQLRLNADIVTLSACQTGLGKLLAGEGVMGMSRAFLYAGAQSLVVSLWNVNDIATAELMKHFYANLKTGMARDEALRQAKLALRKTADSPWQHPYFWAPFIFLGDPGVGAKALPKLTTSSAR